MISSWTLVLCLVTGLKVKHYQELNQVKSELMEQVEKQTKELSNASSEIAKLEAALFNTKNQVERLEKKEDLRKTTETQLIEARKQIILQGELLRYKND